MNKKKLKLFSISVSLLLALLVVFFSGILISRNINYKRVSNESVLEYKVTNDADYDVIVDSNYTNSINNENIISSIINDIKIKFSYKLDPGNINTKSNYVISSRLVINQLKDITITSLVDEEKVISKNDIINNSSISINEEIGSDYKYYYNYIKSYMSKYPITGLEAKIIYTFKVNTKGIVDKSLLDDTSESSVTLSILDPITSIKKSGIKDANRNVFEEKSLPLIKDITMFILGIIMFIIGLLLLIPLFMAINLVNKQNEYRRELTNILRIYDDIIVESSGDIDISGKEIVEVVSFTELLDAEQELHIPIVHNEVVSNQESWFTISCDDKVWRFILKNKNIS